jgi:flagellar hook assembly protein FlgD
MARVFNIAGEKVRELFEAEVPAGVTVEALWDGRNSDGERVAAGIYVVSVQGAGISSLRKVVLMR